jgi:phage terminase Nu1 subunit (DNA packaging protein)
MTDPEQSPSEILARRNVSNIAVKLKAGKTLTTAERKALNEFQSEQSDGWVKDTTTLAKELGLSRQAVYDARARFPRRSGEDTQDGRAREPLRRGRSSAPKNRDREGRRDEEPLADLKAELMREQIRLARAKNQREAGEVIAAEVVDDMLVTLAQKLDLLLRLKLEVELGQRVIGKNAAEANVEGGLILDEIREVINSNIATYQGEMVARSADLSDA